MAAATSSAAQGLAFGMLGPLLVTRAGIPLPLGGRQQKAVLALLLAEAGSVVSVGRLADALWGERTPPRAFATTVQTYVYHLRGMLEPGQARGGVREVLVTDSGRYRLQTANGAVDAQVFERLVASGQALVAAHAYDEASAELSRALGLWRGDVLSDVADYDFVAPVARRLEELRLAALELKIDADLALGHHAAAVAETDQLIALAGSTSRATACATHACPLPVRAAVRRAGRIPQAAQSCWTPSWASSPARRCSSCIVPSSPTMPTWPGHRRPNLRWRSRRTA